MRSSLFLALALATFAATPLARAVDFTVGSNAYNVEYITSGSSGPFTSKALLVLDFDAHVYTFGYQWDGSPRTSAQLLDDVAAAGGVDVTASNPGTPVEFTTGITYSSSGQLYGGPNQFGDYPNNWYLYYISRTPTAWDFGQLGEGLNPVTDGDLNLWAWQTNADGTNAPATLPEPASLALLALGGGALLKRRSGCRL